MASFFQIFYSLSTFGDRDTRQAEGGERMWTSVTLCACCLDVTAVQEQRQSSQTTSHEPLLSQGCSLCPQAAAAQKQLPHPWGIKGTLEQEKASDLAPCEWSESTRVTHGCAGYWRWSSRRKCWKSWNNSPKDRSWSITPINFGLFIPAGENIG